MKTCIQCGAEFGRPPGYSQRMWEEKKLCSVECRHDFLRKPRACKCGCGQRPPDRKLWVPGHLVFSGRKPYVPKPPRPRKYWIEDRYGRCYVRCRGGRTKTAFSRIVVEGMLGRELRPDEHVHHVNGDKTDDRAENLQVISISEHTRLHAEAKTWPASRWLRRCSECGCDHDDRTTGCGACIRRFAARRKVAA